MVPVRAIAYRAVAVPGKKADLISGIKMLTVKECFDVADTDVKIFHSSFSSDMQYL